jgi:hypothetical protein
MMNVRDQPITFTDLPAHQLQMMHAVQNVQLGQQHKFNGLSASHTPAAVGSLPAQHSVTACMALA